MTSSGAIGAQAGDVRRRRCQRQGARRGSSLRRPWGSGRPSVGLGVREGQLRPMCGSLGHIRWGRDGARPGLRPFGGRLRQLTKRRARAGLAGSRVIRNGKISALAGLTSGGRARKEVMIGIRRRACWRRPLSSTGSSTKTASRVRSAMLAASRGGAESVPSIVCSRHRCGTPLRRSCRLLGPFGRSSGGTRRRCVQPTGHARMIGVWPAVDHLAAGSGGFCHRGLRQAVQPGLSRGIR